ncbi:effector binding domain-containing protein [Bacillus sp. FJAT-52991]|uniref:Effector binding domain-containing protein n=1 Tax=Bacillus kandeliae TaxID=3129297 RepID=A0ABZ2N4K8_9BACI
MQNHCQSCGRPLTDQSLLGTEKEGQLSKDYCTYCYEAGEFKQPDLTVEEMIDICVPHLKKDGMKEDQARQMLASFLPNLKRWRKSEFAAPVVVEKEPFQVIGMTARTCNADEMTSKAKIPSLWSAFYQQKVGEKVSHLVKPGIVYGLYSDYTTDVNGEYSITLGMEMSSSEAVPEGVVVKTIPAAKYMVFTSEKGPMPEVVIKAWQDIWAWFAQSEVERTYTGDFEKYDEKCANPEEAQVEIYIAIRG